MYDPEKRRKELEIVFDSIWEDFASSNPGTSLKPSCIDSILQVYSIFLTSIKDVYAEDTNISIYKVASAFEFCVLYFQPVLHLNALTAIELNSKLALNIATQFITSKLFNDDKSLGKLDQLSLSDSQVALLTKHMEYLRVIEHSSILDYNVLINSLFWEAFFISIPRD